VTKPPCATVKPAFRRKHQRRGDAVAYGAGLPGDAAALHMRIHVDLPSSCTVAKGCLHDHAAGFPAKKLVQVRPLMDTLPVLGRR